MNPDHVFLLVSDPNRIRILVRKSGYIHLFSHENVPGDKVRVPDGQQDQVVVRVQDTVAQQNQLI